nr:Uncharacterised protein [Streptococcus thermophilus]
MVPVQLRVGGAFMALAVVLIILAVMAFVAGDRLFTFTPSDLMICVAALLFGGFGTFSRDQQASRSRIVALAAASVLIIASVLTPKKTAVFTTETYWLLLWAGMAIACALILRRSAAA